MAKKTKADTEKEDTSGGSMAVNDAWTGMLVISFFALIVGAAFLGWDYFQYSDKPPTVPKFTGTPPGQPPAVNLPKGDKADDKQPQPKQDKKDASLRPSGNALASLARLHLIDINSMQARCQRGAQRLGC